MNKKHFFIVSLIACLSLCVGCAKDDEAELTPDEEGAPRLVINGTVSNIYDLPIKGINVAIYGVRKPTEVDIKTYNYGITDSLGRYSMIRYRGEEVPTEATLVATDPSGRFQKQSKVCTIKYDSVFVEKEGCKMPYNGFITADFVLSK